jgi:hypothetical protein
MGQPGGEARFAEARRCFPQDCRRAALEHRALRKRFWRVGGQGGWRYPARPVRWSSREGAARYYPIESRERILRRTLTLTSLRARRFHRVLGSFLVHSAPRSTASGFTVRRFTAYALEACTQVVRRASRRSVQLLGLGLLLGVGAALFAGRLDSASSAQRLAGVIYAKGSSRTTPLYRWEADLDNSSGRWRSRYRTPQGELSLEDEVLWNGRELRRYSYVRHNTSENSSVEHVGKKLIYTRSFGGYPGERAEEDFDPNFMVGPTVLPYVQRHWAELMKGEELRIRYGVLDRLQSYGFELNLERGRPSSIKDAVVIRMRATSLFVRMAVDPVYLVWSRDGQILYEMSGRMMPIAKDSAGAHSVDGDLVLAPQRLLPP